MGGGCQERTLAIKVQEKNCDIEQVRRKAARSEWSPVLNVTRKSKNNENRN